MMKLSDGTIINEPIKFLGTIRAILGKQNEIVGCYFSFNSRKMYYDELEKAQTVRDEIIEKIPDAEMIKKELDSRWSEPPFPRVDSPEIQELMESQLKRSENEKIRI